VPLYAWKGISAAGKPATGNREADGPKSLRQILRKRKRLHHRVARGGGGPADQASGGHVGQRGKGLRREVDIKRWFERVRPQDVAIFTRQLATLIHAGFPWPEALGALAEQSDHAS